MKKCSRVLTRGAPALPDARGHSNQACLGTDVGRTGPRRGEGRGEGEGLGGATDTRPGRASAGHPLKVLPDARARAQGGAAHGTLAGKTNNSREQRAWAPTQTQTQHFGSSGEVVCEGDKLDWLTG